VSRTLHIALTLACLALAAQAQPSVQVSVDSTTVFVGEPFAVRVSASGARVGRPVIPHVEELVFNRTPAGTSQSMQIQFVNGRAATNEVHEWTYYATPKREGSITLPPISVRIDGKDYFSEELQLTAEKSPPPQAVPHVPAPRRPHAGGVPDAAQTEKEVTWDDVIQVECTVDKRRAYQGEPLQLTLSIWQLQYWGLSVRYTGPRNLEMPSTEGFYALQPEQEERRASRNGFDYEVQEFTQRIYPMRSGMLEIGPWTWEGMATAMTQFGPKTHSYRLSTQPITIEVLALPEAPPGFTGAVGRFRVQVEIPVKEIEQGVPVDFMVRVSGEGNPDAIGSPVMPELSWAHVHEQLSEVNPDCKGGPSFTKSFRYTLTPLEIGGQSLPSISFCYFDPAAERYRTEDSRPIAVRVIPPSGNASVAAAPTPVAQTQADMKEDIWSIKAAGGSLRKGNGGALAPAVVALAPPVLWSGFLLFMRQQRRLRTDADYARRYYARSRIRKRLRQIAGAADPVQELYRALIEYLGDTCGLNSAGMTSADVRKLLEERGVANESGETLVKILRSCERDRYAAAKLSKDELDALTHAAVSCMDVLEGALRKGAAR